MAVDLAAAKAHLNITTDIDNTLVGRLITAAQDRLERQLGYVPATRYPDGVPPALDQAALLMIGHWYANREASLVGVNAQEIPLGANEIISDYRDWSWGEADA